jgi:RND family efflux transporter MFP subunit
MMAVFDFAHMMSRLHMRAASVAGAVLVSVVAAGCNGSAPSAGAPAGGAPAMPVEAITLKTQPVEQSNEFVGMVKSRRSTTIQPQAEGFITNIGVKSGDHVALGAVLMEIDAAQEQAVISVLESQRAARDSDASWTRQQAVRAKSLLDAGAGSLQEYEQAAAAQKAAEAQLKAVDDQIKQQRIALGYFKVTAPTAGIIGDIPVHQGERVTRGSLLTTIEDNSALEVYINVPVPQAPGLKPGLAVQLTSDAGEVLATERVSFVAPSVDQTQTVLAKAAISRNGLFRPDQFVRARIIWSTNPGITIPVVATLRIDGQYFVFVAETTPNGTVARQRQVVVGAVVGNDYVVQSGLKAGDQLIVGGIQKIGDGAPVHIMPPAAPGGGK